MITSLDIIKTFTKLLESTFDGIKVTNKDLKQGYERPCFYIDIEEVTNALEVLGYVSYLRDRYDIKTTTP